MPRGSSILVLALFVASRAAGREASAGGAILVSPEAPVVGGPLRVVAVSDRPLDGTLSFVAPDGGEVAATGERRGGPPYWWYLEAATRAAGAHRACLEGAETTCTEVAVGRSSPRPTGAGVWPVTREWSGATEALYSAWIEKLFDDPLDVEPSWRALDDVTRQGERNFLHEHLGLGEDGEYGLRLAPDCADLPYFLRAYFAWKLGLPFGWSECSRGEGGHPPRGTRWHSNLEAVDGGDTVARKRYWRGNFLFALDPSLGSAGFKHFRPIVRESRKVRPLANREILMDPDWGDYSLEQYQTDVEGFYDRVDDLLSPEPLDPTVAFRAAIDALDEQIGTRIRAVANGEAFMATHSGTIPMPEGAAIFETTGPWEDYAT